jgi:hypothetical protein
VPDDQNDDRDQNGDDGEHEQRDRFLRMKPAGPAGADDCYRFRFTMLPGFGPTTTHYRQKTVATAFPAARTGGDRQMFTQVVRKRQGRGRPGDAWR